jgi:hypothetical protein
MRHGYVLGRVDQEVVASAVLRIALACTLLSKKSGVSVVQRQVHVQHCVHLEGVITDSCFKIL